MALSAVDEAARRVEADCIGQLARVRIERDEIGAGDLVGTKSLKRYHVDSPESLQLIRSLIDNKVVTVPQFGTFRLNWVQDALDYQVVLVEA